jgi:hypothetical protein
MHRQSSSLPNFSRDGRRRAGTIVLELLMALPCLVIMVDYVIDLSFDAAFMTGMSMAVIEAAREGALAAPVGMPMTDPQGEPSYDPTDLDDIADRAALAAERRLQLLRLRIRPADRRGTQRPTSGVRLVVRRGDLICDRGDATIPIRPLMNTAYVNDIEVILAVRLPQRRGNNGASGDATETTGSPDRLSSMDVMQASARATLE